MAHPSGSVAPRHRVEAVTPRLIQPEPTEPMREEAVGPYDADDDHGDDTSEPSKRSRSRRLIQRKSLDRISPRIGRGKHATELLRIVSLLGAVPLAVAARLSAAVTGRTLTNSYWASQALETAGVIQRVQVAADLHAGRAPSLGLVLAPGERWFDGVTAAGVSHEDWALEPALAPSASAEAVLEEVVLSSEIVRRVALGWTVAHGDAWLLASAAAVVVRPMGDPRRFLPELVRDRALRFEPGDAPVGLVPPVRDGVKSGESPALLLGGSWGTRSRIAAYVDACWPLQPVEMIAVRRGARANDALRAGAAKRQRGGGYNPITLLPSRRGVGWMRYWKDVADTLKAADSAELHRNVARFLASGPMRGR